MRSAAKPLQAMPILESGAVKHFGFTVKELAVMMASHNGQPVHLETVTSILEKANLRTEHLKCGFHRPLHQESADAWLRDGAEQSPLYNNCSGKHAGMLALAQHSNLALDTYLEPDHPVQQQIKHKLSVFTALPEDDIQTGVDGCSAPVFFLPLRNMAQAYARIAEGKLAPAEQSFKIMNAHPDLIAGAGRFDTELMRHTGGRLISKIGAEGIRCVAARGDQPLGIAIKIEDGNGRASAAVMLAVLQQLALVSESELEALPHFVRPQLTNCAGRHVGEIKPSLTLTT